MAETPDAERRPRGVRAAAPAALIALLLLAPWASARAGEGAGGSLIAALTERVRTSAELSFETAWGVTEGRGQKSQLELVPEIEVDLPWSVRLRLRGRARADAYDRLERGEPRQKEVSDATRRALVGDRVEAELREAVLEARVAGAFVSLGKQQIVWGQADGLKVLDVVNPQSFREFILDDFEDSRIPLWAASVEVPLATSASVQALWIPDKSYHDLVGPRPGGLYQFTAPEIAPRAPAGFDLRVRDPERPSRFFEDSDAGARIKGYHGGWDWSLNYLYHYHDVPVLFAEGTLVDGRPTVVVSPRYERTHLAGGTFSTAVGSLTIRGEAAWQSDRFFPADDADGVGEAEEVATVLGLDWFGFRETFLSLQLFHSTLLDQPSALRRGRVEGFATLFARRSFLARTLRLEAMWLVSLDRGDGLVRPRVAYAVDDALTVWAGLDWFYGDRRGLFGEFDPRDRVVLGLEVSL